VRRKFAGMITFEQGVSKKKKLANRKNRGEYNEYLER
jgi:hypothetical protein